MKGRNNYWKINKKLNFLKMKLKKRIKNYKKIKKN